MKKLKIITSTTREGNKGIALAQWINEFAQKTTSFDVELLDLAKINLPFMNEPEHPRLGKYQYEHTKQWSRTIAEADAFIIVLAEYNFGFPAPIKNAIDYLFQEWQYKPVGLLSYGGLSAGLRASQMLKQVLTTLNMVPLAEQVSIPFHSQKIDEQGVFHADEAIIKSAELMLEKLDMWAENLSKLRVSKH